jgi:6-pyruvoyltetrahydropterin/6-carboxytetrahydropterin synthase
VNTTVIEKFDHSLVLSEAYLKEHPTNNIHDNLIIWEVEPSAENILLYLQEVLNAKLPEDIKLLQIKLYETKDSFAEWIADN